MTDTTAGGDAVREVIDIILQVGVLVFWEAIRDVELQSGAEPAALADIDEQIKLHQALNPLEIRVLSRAAVRRLKALDVAVGRLADTVKGAE